MSAEGDLSRLARYESLFELSSEINTASEITQVGEVMARRLKYAADVYSWRYLSIERESVGAAGSGGNALIIDGYQGAATLANVRPEQLSSFEAGLWEKAKNCFSGWGGAGRSESVSTEAVSKG